jgi:hypothetical protein
MSAPLRWLRQRKAATRKLNDQVRADAQAAAALKGDFEHRIALVRQAGV